MTPPPINIDGTTENYSTVTIDGQDVEQITIDGQDVLSAIPDNKIYQSQVSSSEWKEALSDRYTDLEALLAVSGSTVDGTNFINVDANEIDGFDIQKNGTDGNGIINFKTN